MLYASLSCPYKLWSGLHPPGNTLRLNGFGYLLNLVHLAVNGTITFDSANELRLNCAAASERWIMTILRAPAAKPDHVLKAAWRVQHLRIWCAAISSIFPMSPALAQTAAMPAPCGQIGGLFVIPLLAATALVFAASPVHTMQH